MCGRWALPTLRKMITLVSGTVVFSYWMAWWGIWKQFHVRHFVKNDLCRIQYANPDLKISVNKVPKSPEDTWLPEMVLVFRMLCFYFFLTRGSRLTFLCLLWIKKMGRNRKWISPGNGPRPYSTNWWIWLATQIGSGTRKPQNGNTSSKAVVPLKVHRLLDHQRAIDQGLLLLYHSGGTNALTDI